MKLKKLVTAMSAAMALLNGAAQAAPTYSVTVLGPKWAVATDINSSGDAVGAARLQPWPSGETGVLYTGGNTIPLGLGGTYSTAEGINNSGQVVGNVTTGVQYGPQRAVLYSQRTVTDLGTLGGTSSRAFAINDSGQVVGDAETAAGSHEAFLYSGGNMTSLGPPSTNGSTASDINQSGQIVGWRSNYGYSGTAADAFLYSNGTLTDLGPLMNGNFSYAMGINDKGQVIGTMVPVSSSPYSLGPDPTRSSAFLYSEGKVISFGGLSDRETPLDINNKGEIVGYYYQGVAGAGANHAFYYHDGIMTNLTSLLDPQSDWVVTYASAINDSGQIVAEGYSNSLGYGGALLLTPVPEPEAYLMMLAGLGLIGVIVRRRNAATI